MATRDQDVPVSTAEGVLVREGSYGTQVMTVEPGGAEFIPLNERHGLPVQLFWTWTSPNMEFATIFVGVLAVAGFGLGFWEAALALILGSGIGGITQGILSLRGPKYGVPQMVLSRLGFGYWGNALPAGLNSVTAGIGWFAVNSVSGALALNVLTHLPQVLCLLIIVVVQVAVAFFGYNLVHLFERYAFPILTVVFLIAAGVILSKAHPGAVHHTIPGAFLLTFGASFGYAVGWNPYASDYTRYFKPDTSRIAIAWWSGTGLFLSCALLEIVGAAVGTVGRRERRARRSRRDDRAAGHPAGRPDAAGHRARRGLGERAQHLLRRAVVHRDRDQAAAVAAAGDRGARVRRHRVLPGLERAAQRGQPSTRTSCSSSRTGSPRGWPSTSATCCCAATRTRRCCSRRGGRTGPGRWPCSIGMGISIWLFSNQTEYIGVVPSHVPVGRRPDLRGRVRDHRGGVPDLARHRRDRAGEHAGGLTFFRVARPCGRVCCGWFQRVASGKSESAPRLGR